MRILVTGGAGFIGSHLVDRLVKMGHHVAVIDNLSTGKQENVHPWAKLYLGDAETRYLDTVMKLEKPEFVFHLAGQVSVIESMEHMIIDMKWNIQTMLRLIETSKRHGVRKIVYTSTCAVYGDAEQLPIKETTKPSPLSPYAVSKLTAELYLRTSGIPNTIFRFGNVYGTRQESGVIPLILFHGNKGETFSLYGDGSAIRDYIYVQDVVDALVQAIDNGTGHTLNIATGQPTSVNELIEYANQILPEELHVKKKEAREGEIKLSLLDIEKAIRILEWKPTTSVLEGMKEMQKIYDKLVE